MPAVADTIAESLWEKGVDTAFTLLGTTNFPFTQSLKALGADIYRARHENGVIAMTTAWAQVTGRVGVCTISKGAGLTHGLTALMEAKKSNTPLLVLAGDTPATAIYSSPAAPQEPLVNSLGIASDRLHTPETVSADIERAYRRAERTRGPVVLMAPSDLVKSQAAAETVQPPPAPPLPAPGPPAPEAVAEAVEMIAAAKRPALLGGRGVVAAGATADARALGERMGALLTTTALAHGLFTGMPASLGMSGGYATPHAVEQLAEADVVVALGASLNDWTMRAGAMFPNARLIQVDTDPTAFGRQYPIDLAIQADVGATARALLAALEERGVPAAILPDSAIPPVVPVEPADASFEVDGEIRIKPGALTALLNEMLPADRNVATDGGGFLAHSVRLDPGDAEGWVFAITYMSIGLGFPAGLGTAVARPDRITVITVGDATMLNAFADLETLARLKLPIVVVVYNDSAHGLEAEVFEKKGLDVDLLEFPEFDFAAVAAAAGVEAATIRTADDLAVVRDWLERRDGALLLDAKIALEPSEELFTEVEGWTVELMKKQGL